MLIRISFPRFGLKRKIRRLTRFIELRALPAKLRKLNVGDLLETGYTYLENEEYEEAEIAANELMRKRNTGYFEILARSFWERGNERDAIRVLEHGVKLYPRLHVLSDYLASFYSDLGQYEKALELYEKCYGMVGAHYSMVTYNIAIVLNRMERHQEAFDRLETVLPDEPDEWMRKIRVERVWLLTDMGRFDQAIAEAEAAVKDYPDNHEALTSLARAVWRATGDKDRALALAHQALCNEKRYEPSAYLLREIRNERSSDASLYLVVVGGKQCAPWDESSLYLVSAKYSVIADDDSRVLEFVEPFEPDMVEGTLKIESIKKVRAAPDELFGVVWVEGRYYACKDK